MKLLIVSTYYLPHRTGMTLHIERMARGMAARGHEVVVLTARHDPASPWEEVLDGVRIVRFRPILRISRGVIMPAFFWHIFFWLRKMDVVSLHSPSLEMIWTAPVCRLMGKPFLISHHGDLTLPKDKFVSRIVEPVVYALSLFAACLADRLTGYSQDYIDYSSLLRHFRRKTVVVYPPAVVQEPSLASVQAVRDRLKLRKEKIIGYAGRFVEEKRPDRLIRALPFLKEKLEGVKIVFAGPCKLFYENYFEKCRDLIHQYADDLIFLGLLDNEQDVANFYKLCDVLVLPSDTECLGLVQVEAMLCGTPVVVNNIPGGREAVRVTGMGEIVDCDDPKELSEAIVRLIEKPQYYVKPKSVVEEKYSYPRTVDQYEALFFAALKKRKGP